MKARTVAALLVPTITVLLGPLAEAYTIEFSQNLSGGDFYKTQTFGSAIYNGTTGLYMTPAQAATGVPTKNDFNISPTSLGDPRVPLVGKNGKTGTLNLWGLPFSAIESAHKINAQDVSTVGSASFLMNIGGTFKVKPEANDPVTGSVPLIAKGVIDGGVGVGLQWFTAPPGASFSAEIEIEKLGKAKAAARSTGTQSETVGLTPTIEKETGTLGTFSQSTQATSQGTGPQNFTMQNWAPVNQDLSWNMSFSLQANNTQTIRFLKTWRSAAHAWLTSQFVNLTPQSKRVRAGKKKVAMLSDSIFRFDEVSGALQVAHASSGSTSAGLAADDPDATFATAPAPAFDYQGLLPEVEAMLINDQLVDDVEDALSGAALDYSPVFVQGTGQDGRIAFTDSNIRFIDAHNSEQVLATAELRDLVADPITAGFSAHLDAFQYEALAAGESELADSLAAYGGVVTLSSDIIEQTEFLATSGVSMPFTVQIAANEPDADFDQDGDTDGYDFLQLQRVVGTEELAPGAPGDANFDGRADRRDFLLWQAGYGSSAAIRAISAPEPQSLILLLIGAAISCSRRWVAK